MKVSIIIPTRNRGHLLQYALESAVLQEFKDLEIIVSDNNSKDNTREVVESFSDLRIKYFKTDEDLTMPDNWESALSKSNGEYVTFLTDDSFLFRNCIKEVIEELEKVNLKVAIWKHCTYFSSDWLEPGRKNLLYIPKTTSKSFVIDSKESLKDLFNNPGKVPIKIPRVLNSICHRSIIEKIKSVQGRFFLPSCPDYTSAASIMLNESKYLIIDKPYFIDYVTSYSAGATTAFNLGKGAKEYIGEFNKEEDVSFLGIPVISADIAKSLEEVRKFYPECVEVNKDNLLFEIVDQLNKIESNKGEISMYWKKLDSYLNNHPLKKRLYLYRIFSRIKWKLMNKIRSSSYLRFIEAPRIKSRNIILKGHEKGFNNVKEAAKIVYEF